MDITDRHREVLSAFHLRRSSRALGQVRAWRCGEVVRGRYPTTLDPAEVASAVAAGELVVIDAYGAAADICSTAEAPGDGGAGRKQVAMTRNLGLVPAAGLALTSVRAIDCIEGDAAADQVPLVYWFRRAATVRAVTERCRAALGRTAPAAIRVLLDSNADGDVAAAAAAAAVLPLDMSLNDLAGKGVGSTIRLILDLRSRPEVVVEVKAGGGTGGGRGNVAAVLPLDFPAAGLGRIAMTVLPQAENLAPLPKLYPPPPRSTTLRALVCVKPRVESGAAEAAAAELLVVHGDAVLHAVVPPSSGGEYGDGGPDGNSDPHGHGSEESGTPRAVHALVGGCKIPLAGGLHLTIGGALPPRAASACTMRSAGGVELHLWPLLPRDTAGDVLAALAAMGVLCGAGPVADRFDLLLSNGLTAASDIPLCSQATDRAWVVRRESLIAFTVGVGGGAALKLRASPGCLCSDVERRAGDGTDVAAAYRLVCCGVAVPNEWTVADLPLPSEECDDQCGGTLIQMAPAGTLTRLRLSVSLQGENAGAMAKGAAVGFPAEVDVLRCTWTRCSALVDAAAAAHGGSAAVCTLMATPGGDAEPASEVDLGEDEGGRGGGGGGGGFTLEELLMELCEGRCGPAPTLSIGLRVNARRLAAAVAADGGPASPARAVFAAPRISARAACRAALAVHRVPATAMVMQTIGLWFRCGSSISPFSASLYLTHLFNCLSTLSPYGPFDTCRLSLPLSTMVSLQSKAYSPHPPLKSSMEHVQSTAQPTPNA